MADQYYKVTSGDNRHTNWTSEVVLERDDDGTVTKSVKVGEPIQLNAEDRAKLEELGFEVESSSKSEAEEIAESQPAGSDIAGTAPVFGTTTDQPNQPSAIAPDDKSGKSR